MTSYLDLGKMLRRLLALLNRLQLLRLEPIQSDWLPDLHCAWGRG